MSYIYTAWPTATNVQTAISVAGVTLRAGADAAWIGAKLAAVIAEVTRRTHRTFEAVTEIRYFDGSGTGELEIDEFIDVTAVSVIGYIGTQGLSLSFTWEQKQNTFPQTRIQIFQGSLPAFTRIWLDSFPEGRSNIAVTASWGYGAAIPADLWQAVLEETAAKLTAEATFQQTGRLQEWKEGTASEKYDLNDANEPGWSNNFTEICKLYKRGLSRHLRSATPRMT